MADLDSKDFNILSTLKLTDRITLTDSETGHQFASMEVSTFLKQMAHLIPSATMEAKGLAPRLEELGTFSYSDIIDFNGVRYFSVIGTVNGPNTPREGRVKSVLTIPCSNDWAVQFCFYIEDPGCYSYRYFVSGNRWSDWITKYF